MKVKIGEVEFRGVITKSPMSNRPFWLWHLACESAYIRGQKMQRTKKVAIEDLRATVAKLGGEVIE